MLLNLVYLWWESLGFYNALSLNYAAYLSYLRAPYTFILKIKKYSLEPFVIILTV